MNAGSFEPRSKLLILHRAHLGRVDAALLHLARNNVNGVLRNDDKILADLVDLADERGELLIRLHEHLLLGLGILTNEGLARRRLHIVVELERLVLLNGKTRRMEKRGRMRENFLLRCRSRRLRRRGGRRGSRHSRICRRRGKQIYTFSAEHASSSACFQ